MTRRFLKQGTRQWQSCAEAAEVTLETRPLLRPPKAVWHLNKFTSDSAREGEGTQMAGQSHETVGGIHVEERHRAAGHPVALAASAFALGLVAGLFLKGTARQLHELARGTWWHRAYDRTVTYDENLPDSLGRREPAPHPGQPRFGGTGALGVSPAAAGAPPSSEP